MPGALNCTRRGNSDVGAELENHGPRIEDMLPSARADGREGGLGHSTRTKLVSLLMCCSADHEEAASLLPSQSPFPLQQTDTAQHRGASPVAHVKETWSEGKVGFQSTGRNQAQAGRDTGQTRLATDLGACPWGRSWPAGHGTTGGPPPPCSASCCS